jgi:altronate dehydratase small subunit
MTKKAIVMEAADNVATAVENIEPRTDMILDVAGNRITVQVTERILFGHKFAIRDISRDDAVFKYGEPIGVAQSDIKTGQHVHVHNLESRRGRGDKNPEPS